MISSSHENYFDLIGPYVLDAVDDNERTTIESHLLGCEICASEVAVLREALSSIAPSDDAANLDDLWTSISNTIEPKQNAGLAKIHPFPKQRTDSPGRQAAFIASVAAFVAIAAVSATTLVIDHNNPILSSNTKLQTQIIHNVANSPGHEYITLKSTNKRLYLQLLIAGNGVAYVTKSDLPSLGNSNTYQLWGISSSTISSISLLGSQTSGQVISIPKNSNFKELAVSQEPAGGSISPTTTPIVTVQF